jgi:hypothetical protein
MNKLKISEIITETVHDVLSQSELKNSRCLYTSAVVLDLLKRHDIEAKLWQGSTQWYSKKYAQLFNEGYDFNQVTSGFSDEKKLKKKAEALRRKGVLSVSCISNNALTKEELGGHVAIMAKMDEQYFLIDPTSYQFKRNQAEHNAIIDAPNAFYFELFPPEYNNPGNIVSMQDDFGILYEFTYLHSLDNLQNHKNIIATDFNPFKYQDLYDKISNEVKRKIEELGN